MFRSSLFNLFFKHSILVLLICHSPVLAQRKPAVSAEQHFSRGVALLEKQQGDPAIEELRLAIKMKPGFAEAYNVLGLALARKGDARLAAESFRKAVALDPKQYKAYRNLGQALQQLGDVDGAVN